MPRIHDVASFYIHHYEVLVEQMCQLHGDHSNLLCFIPFCGVTGHAIQQEQKLYGSASRSMQTIASVISGKWCPAWRDL
jgi:hypothetical protein